MTAPAAPEPKASLGVLFVHGMGTHAQGETLRDMGEPLVEWLKLGHVGIESLDLTETRLAPGDGDEPAHVRCVLTTKDGARRSWILAESCWSQSFTPPSYARMAFWLIASVPWMLGDYLRGAWLREKERKLPGFLRWPRQVLQVVYAAVGAVLAGPVVLLLTTLLLVRLIPIERVRKAADKLPRVLAASLGDVYVILTTHIDRASIRDQIVRNHVWLRGQCDDNTVVVAHSAGSAVTHQLLRDGRLAGVHTYVTLGEAIWRMKWMVDLSRTRAVMRIGAIGLAVTGTVCLAGGVIAASAAAWPCVAILLGAGIALHSASVAIVRKHTDTDSIRLAAVDLLGDIDVRWRDYVASSDPVPAGALTEPAHTTVPSRRSAVDPDRSHYVPIGVRNRRSIIRDHTSYTANTEGFVAGLACDLAAADNHVPALALTITPGELKEGRDARALRTLSLALMRATSAFVGLTVVVVAAANPGGWSNVGEQVDWVSEALKSMLPEDLDPHVTAHNVGIATVAVLFVAAWLLATQGWGIWDRMERKRFFGPEKGSTRLRNGQLAVAAGWWICTATAAITAYVLSEVTDAGAWIVLGLVLTGGVVLLGSLQAVKQQRDRLYTLPESAAPQQKAA